MDTEAAVTHDSTSKPPATRAFLVEMCDSIEFQFMHRHRVVTIEAAGIKEAMNDAFMQFPIKHGWYVAQVLRQFSDCALPQPVFDVINGLAASEAVINTAQTWRELLLSNDRHEEDPRPLA